MAQIEDATNELVGRYNIAEHIVYQGLQHERLNRIFELVGVLCQPRPEPVAWKRKSAATATTLVPRKTFEKWGRGRGSNCFGAQTSAQELAFANPLKCSMKFAAKSSGLSPTEKASLAGVRAASKKTLDSVVGRGEILAPKHALKLFYSDLSASNEEAAPSEGPQKCCRASSVPKDIPKPSPVEGMVESDLFFFLLILMTMRVYPFLFSLR
jgi:hypothetical protein